MENPSGERLELVEESLDYTKLKEQYEQYTEKIRLGEHDSTAQFWMIYIDLIELYLLFSRACHTNDVPLFVHCLHKMCHVFVSTGRPNYSRWMVKYSLNLLNAEETHPGITEVLQKSGLTIRRTSKSFLSCPVDLH